MSAPILVLYLIAFPETSAETILRRRAQRLRKLTGRTDLRSQSEIKQAQMTVSSIFVDAVIKPVEIMVKDPAVFFTNVYVRHGPISFVMYFLIFWLPRLLTNFPPTDSSHLRHLLFIFRGLPTRLPSHVRV